MVTFSHDHPDSRGGSKVTIEVVFVSNLKTAYVYAGHQALTNYRALPHRSSDQAVEVST